jgi:predicted secreted protein
VAKRPSVYQSESIQEVRARAESIQQKPSTEERDGLTRLNQILGSDQPLRDNVPRGFYLNIKI